MNYYRTEIKLELLLRKVSITTKIKLALLIWGLIMVFPEEQQKWTINISLYFFIQVNYFYFAIMVMGRKLHT